MYFKNVYLTYSDVSLESLKQNGIMGKQDVINMCRIARYTLEDIILSSSLINKENLNSCKLFTKYKINATNAKAVLISFFSRKVILEQRSMDSLAYGLTYNLDAPSVIKGVTKFIDEVVEESNLVYLNNQRTISQEFKNYLTYKMVSCKPSDYIFELLEDYALSMGSESLEFKGYMGISTSYVATARLLINNSTSRKDCSIYMLEEYNEILEDILKYTLGLCIREKNLVALLYVALISADVNKKRVF